MSKKFQGKKMPKGGKVPPVYVSDKNDPRYKAYQDSLSVYNAGLNNAGSNNGIQLFSKDYSYQDYLRYPSNNGYTKQDIAEGMPYSTNLDKGATKTIGKYHNNPNYRPIGTYMIEGIAPAFKKPVQPVKLGRPDDILQRVSPVDVSNTQFTPPAFLSTNTHFPQLSVKPSPTGEPVYAKGGENMPLLGYYNNDGTFQPDNSNPDSEQYLGNEQYMNDLMKRNYGSGYNPQKKWGGKMADDGIELLQERLSGYLGMNQMPQLQSAPMQQMPVQPVAPQPLPVPQENTPMPAAATRTKPKGKTFTTPGTGDLIAGSIGLANALLPNQMPNDYHQPQYGSYNPNAYGTGSTALYDEGGKVAETNDPTYNALSSVLMNRNMDKNFVQRAYHPQEYPVINNADGTHSSHLMSYDTNNDGTGRVFPNIVQGQDGKLQKLQGEQAWEHADSTGQYIQTPSWKMAEYLSNRGYKNAAGMYDDGGMIPSYKQRFTSKEGGIKVTQEVPTNLGYGNVQPDNIPLATPQFTSGPKHISYESLNTVGQRQVFSPKFQGFSPGEIRNQWNSIPQQIGGKEVLRGQAWEDLQGGQPHSPIATKQYQPIFGNNNVSIDTADTHYSAYHPETAPRWSFEDGGRIEVGQKLTLSPVERLKLEAAGYRFK